MCDAPVFPPYISLTRPQIVMSAHKESALDEKRYHFRFGATCVTGFSQPIHTSSFDSFEDFFAHLQTSWDKMWGEVFSADAAGVCVSRAQCVMTTHTPHSLGAMATLLLPLCAAPHINVFVFLVLVSQNWTLQHPFAARSCCLCFCCLCLCVHTALPYLQPQPPGLPMPPALRASQLLLATAEGILAVWLLRQTWRAWSSLVGWLCSSLGLAAAGSLVQQVGGGLAMCRKLCLMCAVRLDRLCSSRHNISGELHSETHSPISVPQPLIHACRWSWPRPCCGC